jgi:hypothetical protein
MTANQFERHTREVGYGMLDLGVCGVDPDDAVAADALGGALRLRLAESGVP